MAKQQYYENRVRIVSRAGKDGEFSYTSNGLAKLRFSMPINTGKDKKTAWITVNAYGKLAEENADAIKKGMWVGFEGRLSPWEGSDGKFRMDSFTATKIFFPDNNIKNKDGWEEIGTPINEFPDEIEGDNENPPF